ncbi:MAG: chromosomal replication initiator protein DnaA [Thermomicrobiales bacterium]
MVGGMHIDQTWKIVLSDLRDRGRIQQREFITYLERTRLLALDKDAGKAVVGAPDTFAVENLTKKYREKIAGSLRAVVGRTVEVEFSVLNSDLPVPSAKPASAGKSRGNADNAPAPKPGIGTPPPQANRTVAPPLPAAQQLELGNDGLNPRYLFSTYIVGPSNRLAHAASLAVADNPGGVYNPLFIYGGVGLGKTHLLHATGHHARARLGGNLRVLYLTSERFTNELIASIRSGKMEEFRDRYRTVDILMIDDIQFIAGKDSTQEEFFHTFNHLHQAGKHIILSSDRQPKAIATLDDRLRSRFEWGLIADVQPPDLETRIAILQQKGESSGISIPREVLDYVAQKVQSNIRELEGTLNRIIAHAQLEGVPVTLALATGAMNDPQLNAKRKLITLPRILEAVSRYYNVHERDLKGKGRTKDIVIPRQVAMYIMREETDRSLVDIGELLGRDHTTVLHGINKTADDIERTPERRQEVLTIRELLYAPESA